MLLCIRRYEFTVNGAVSQPELDKFLESNQDTVLTHILRTLPGSMSEAPVYHDSFLEENVAENMSKDEKAEADKEYDAAVQTKSGSNEQQPGSAHVGVALAVDLVANSAAINAGTVLGALAARSAQLDISAAQQSAVSNAARAQNAASTFLGKPYKPKDKPYSPRHSKKVATKQGKQPKQPPAVNPSSTNVQYAATHLAKKSSAGAAEAVHPNAYAEMASFQLFQGLLQAHGIAEIYPILFQHGIGITQLQYLNPVQVRTLNLTPDQSSRLIALIMQLRTQLQTMAQQPIMNPATNPALQQSQAMMQVQSRIVAYQQQQMVAMQHAIAQQRMAVMQAMQPGAHQTFTDASSGAKTPNLAAGVQSGGTTTANAVETADRGLANSSGDAASNGRVPDTVPGPSSRAGASEVQAKPPQLLSAASNVWTQSFLANVKNMASEARASVPKSEQDLPAHLR